MLVNERILFLKPALCTEGTGVIQEHQEWRCWTNNDSEDGGLYWKQQGKVKVNELQQEECEYRKKGEQLWEERERVMDRLWHNTTHPGRNVNPFILLLWLL